MQSEQSIHEQLGGSRVNFRTTETVDRRATRWLFYPLDVLIAARKQEFKRLRHGGDELGLATNSLYRGFVPKCAFVPLEVAPAFLPLEFVRENAELLEVDEVTSEPDAWRGRPGVGVYGISNLRGVAQYPADDIKSVTNRNDDNGMQKGIKEITVLRGVKWEKDTCEALQLFFFPNFDAHEDGPRVPEALSDVEQLIRDGILRHRNGARVGDFNLEAIGREMLEACDACRNWATTKINIDHALLSLGTTPMGWTYTYSDLVETLLPQLGIERQDAHLRNQKRQNEDNSANLAQLTASISQLVTAMVAQQQSQGAAIGQKEIAEMVAEAIAAQAPTIDLEAPKNDNLAKARAVKAQKLAERKAEQENATADSVSDDGERTDLA